MKPYMLQKVQAMTKDVFCGGFQNWIGEGEALLSHVMCNDEAMYLISTVDRYIITRVIRVYFKHIVTRWSLDW
jgi:hypothetical protein